FGELMLGAEGDEVDVGPGEALAGIAKEGPRESFDGLAAKGRHSAIGGATVVEMLVAEVEPGGRPCDDGDRRIDPVTLQVDVMTEAVPVLIESVHPNADVAAQRLVDVAGEAISAKAVARRR